MRLRLIPQIAFVVVASSGVAMSHDRFNAVGQPATGTIKLGADRELSLAISDKWGKGSMTYRRGASAGPTDKGLAGTWETSSLGSAEASKGLKITLPTPTTLQIVWWRHQKVRPRLLVYQETAWAEGSLGADGSLRLRYTAPPQTKPLASIPAELPFLRKGQELVFEGQDPSWTGLSLTKLRRAKGGQERFSSEGSTRSAPPTSIWQLELSLSRGSARLVRRQYSLLGASAGVPLYSRRVLEAHGLVKGERIVFRAPRSTAWKGFCLPCEKKGGYTEDVGTCVVGTKEATCRRGTASGEFGLCDPCAARLDQCPRCQLPLAGAKPKGN